MSDNSDLEGGQEIELPHGAWFDPETGMVSIPIDRIIVSMSFSEFEEFTSSISDIATILAQIAVKQHEECPTCGTKFEVIEVAPLEDPDEQMN